MDRVSGKNSSGGLMPSGPDLKAKYFKRPPVPSERFFNKSLMKSVTWAPKIISGEVQPDVEPIHLISARINWFP